MKIYVDKIGRLKDFLESKGYFFPCNGEGKCGRCRINAPSLIPTPLDNRFLQRKDIMNGVRLACDKVILSPIEIECNLKLKPQKVELEDPAIYAILGANHTEFGLTNDGVIVEKVELPTTAHNARDLVALFNSNVIELYEKHNVVIAETILLLGESLKIQALMNLTLPLEEHIYFDAYGVHLPSNNILILPISSQSISNDLFIETLYLPDDTLLISGGNFIYKGKDIILTSIGEDTYSQQGKRALLATIKYFEHEYCPSHIFSFDDLKPPKGVIIEKIERRASYIASDLLSSYRGVAELDRLAKRVIHLSVADEDSWQKFFSEQ